MKAELIRGKISTMIVFKKDDGSELIIDEMSHASTGKAFATLTMANKFVAFMDKNKFLFDPDIAFGKRLPFGIEFTHAPKQPIEIKISQGEHELKEVFPYSSLVSAKLALEALKKCFAALGLNYEVVDLDY